MSYALDHVEIDPHARGKSRYLVFPGPKYQLNGAILRVFSLPIFLHTADVVDD